MKLLVFTLAVYSLMITFQVFAYKVTAEDALALATEATEDLEYARAVTKDAVATSRSAVELSTELQSQLIALKARYDYTENVLKRELDNSWQFVSGQATSMARGHYYTDPVLSNWSYRTWYCPDTCRVITGPGEKQ